MLSVTDAVSSLLQEHNGQKVCVLDLRGINNWTDFFIIATATSGTHMDGLERHIKDFCRERDIEIFNNSRTKGSRKTTDDQWRLVDLGPIIVHLLTSDARDFYELERLWTPIPARHTETPA